ncbi:MAG: class I SAM-dependent RNA methyltransferase [Clostridiales bacterium]|nr:class I SAM-dependent RNA methyltransferase [Clostridiales bacterium]
MNDYKIKITSASGVEGVVKRELTHLGYPLAPSINGTLTLDGNDSDVAKLNMFLRTADRVYIEIASFKAENFDELFEGVYNINWEYYLPKDARIYVNGKSQKSKIFALSASQKIIKKAILKRLSKAYKTEWFSENGYEIKVEFNIYEDIVSIMLNTSGQGLHKRGYRDMVGIAPIKETLASAMILLSDYYYKRPLVDPFCGSGTIVLESAKIALNIASGIDRDFDFNHFQFFDKTVFNKVVEEARDLEERDREISITGYDIDKKAIELSKYHAKKLGLENKVHFEVKDVKDFTSSESRGVIITNPPYGERVLEKEEALSLYKTLGGIYKKLDNWSLFLITSADGFERAFNKKADKNRKLYNSNKQCRFYQYFSKRV